MRWSYVIGPWLCKDPGVEQSTAGGGGLQTPSTFAGLVHVCRSQAWDPFSDALAVVCDADPDVAHWFHDLLDVNRHGVGLTVAYRVAYALLDDFGDA